MSTALEKVAREAVDLPRHQRLALARFLFERDDSAADEDVQEAWDAEISERVRAVQEGRTEGIPCEPVLARVDRHIRWIAMHPDLPRIRPGGYRRVNLKVFPYNVAYVLHQQVLWVLAIAHGHRKPEYWIGRRLNLSQQDARPNDEERDRPPVAD